MRPVVAFLPRDLVEVVERRADADGVPMGEALGRLVAETVPRMLAETLERIATGMRTSQRRADETPDDVELLVQRLHADVVARSQLRKGTDPICAQGAESIPNGKVAKGAAGLGGSR